MAIRRLVITLSCLAIFYAVGPPAAQARMDCSCPCIKTKCQNYCTQTLEIPYITYHCEPEVDTFDCKCGTAEEHDWYELGYTDKEACGCAPPV
jgi:hypothetical protein